VSADGRSEKPRWPGQGLRNWCAGAALLFSLGTLLGVYQSALLKFAAVGIVLLAGPLIVSFYLGRLRQWHIGAAAARELEREIQLLEAELCEAERQEGQGRRWRPAGRAA
jgi:hypothetical protein